MEKNRLKKLSRPARLQMSLGAIAALLGVAVAMPSARAADPSSWYASINAGRSYSKIEGSDIDGALAGQGITSTSSVDRHHNAWTLDLGYQITPNFAVEAGYVDLGKFGFNTAVTAPAVDTISGRVKTTGYNLSLVAIAPLAQGWSVYGKGGFFDAKTEFDANSGGVVATTSGSHKSNNGTYGLGAGYEITKNISANLEWNRYLKVGDSSTSKADVDLVTLGLQFKF